MFNIRKALRRFTRSERGDTAIMFALTAIPVILAAGAGVDYATYAAAKTHLQASLDSAALSGAAASGKTDTERAAIAQATFTANMSAGAAAGYTLTSDFRVDNGTFIASAKVEVPTSLMKLAGINNIEANGSAEVGLAAMKKAEIAMVLDYSGSMGDVSGTKVKYIAMREAATKLVDDLTTASPGKVKFGLVPFSHHVYVTLPKAYVKGATGTGTWTGCTQDRKYPYNLTAATPTSNVDTKWNQPMAPDHASDGCSGYAPRSLIVRPLTTDSAAVKAQLAAMKPYAWTHIALGVEFGYHILMDNLPFDQGAPKSDTETQKFMIVLTDGMQTEPAFGPGSSRNVSQGEKNLTQLCTNAKADGIRIITLAFDLDDTTTRARLKNCASDADSFFIANSDTDLSKAFEEIKTAVASEIYLKK
ncbi:vWA domain-containing protein [Aestuariivirga sp.]|uniref:vWA domain-containing protein n=1 Tax=Aestuariivirga sp. TaxID=2650926 RepID=UPI0039E7251D